MKWKGRLQALMLVLAMIVTFMPAASFAEGGSAAQIDNDLDHYEIRFNDIKDGDWRVFTESKSNILLDVDVVLKDKEDVIAIASSDDYDLKIIKETYTDM